MIKLLSTDSVREVMRKYVDKEDDPILYASTYECGDILKA